MDDLGAIISALFIATLATIVVGHGAWLASHRSAPGARPGDHCWPDGCAEHRVSIWYGALLVVVGAAAQVAKAIHEQGDGYLAG